MGSVFVAEEEEREKWDSVALWLFCYLHSQTLWKGTSSALPGFRHRLLFSFSK